MPIPIIIAILVALTLGVKMNQPKADSARVVIVGGKQNNGVDKKQIHDNLVEVAHDRQEQATTVEGQHQTEEVENNFRIWTLYHIIE